MIATATHATPHATHAAAHATNPPTPPAYTMASALAALAPYRDGSTIPADIATALTIAFRAGCSISKNQGRPAPDRVGPLRLARLPLSLFVYRLGDSEAYEGETLLDFLRDTSNPARVAEYAGQQIDTPIFALPPSNRARGWRGWFVSDGAHRLLAAFARGDKDILALVPAGAAWKEVAQ